MYRIHNSPSGNKIISIEQNGVRTSFGEWPDNTDYQEYLAWLAAGNEPEVIEA